MSERDGDLPRTVACPNCGQRGRPVDRVTLESLLVEDRRVDIGVEHYHVCTTPNCETVYFGADDGSVFAKCDLSVRFGLKETEAPRPVCYCFGHSVESIHEEIRRTGGSTVLDAIKGAMKGEGCRCAVRNPMGCCCLKSVAEVVDEGFRGAGCANRNLDGVVPASKVEERCCVSEVSVGGSVLSGDRTGLLSASGSVLAALLSSACCWLPLLLVAFGVSAAGVAGFFETYRSYFIGGSVVLLGIGFYTLYFRSGSCGVDSSCTGGSRRLRLFSRVMLWCATCLVGAFVFFPSYVGYLFAAPAVGTAVGADVRVVETKFRVDGMTCEGCAVGLRAALGALPEVVSVEVDYATRMAVVRSAADGPPIADKIVRAVAAAGYRAATIDEP